MMKTGRVPGFLDRVSEALGFPMPIVQSNNVIDIRDSFAAGIYALGQPAEEERTLMDYFSPLAVATHTVNGRYLGLEQALGDLTNIGNKQEARTRTRLNPFTDLEIAKSDSSEFKQDTRNFLEAKTARKAR